MKPYTHPVRTITRLQNPDGSTTFRAWLYRRSTLRLDPSSKAWLALVATSSSTRATVANHQTKEEAPNPVPPTRFAGSFRLARTRAVSRRSL